MVGSQWSVADRTTGLPDPRGSLEDAGNPPGYDGKTESQVWKLISPLPARFYCTLARLSVV